MKIRLPLIIATILFATSLNAQTSTQHGPDGFVKIAQGSGGFIANIESGDRFSRDHDVAGDINGDGVLDLIVGARSDDDGATDAGAVYILFMNSDGSVASNQKISMTSGGFTDTLPANSFFGYGVAGIGDYDGDTIPDIAVSSTSPQNTALYIIHLNTDGTVKNYVKNANIMAQGLTAIGDINGDGRIDLIASDPKSDDGGTNRGAINLIFLDATSQVVTSDIVTISSTQGGFGTGLANGDEFGGRETAMLGDIDDDGTLELAVGAFMSDGGKGAIWMLSLDANTFNVVSKLKITEGLNGFTDALTLGTNPNGSVGAQFGHALAAVGDLNGDGIPDLVTGANQQNEGWAYILYLNPDKTVKTFTRLNNTDGGFDIVLDSEERFSRSISFVGDLRGDGTIAVNIGGGAAGPEGGILYLLFFKPCDFNLTSGNNFYADGNTLFTNWNHNTQTVTDPLTFEQCTFKAFETDAPFMTYQADDGRCICKDETAVLSASTEGSSAYSNQCYSALLSNDEVVLNLSQLNIYPNPTTDKLNIELSEDLTNNNVEVFIYATDGKLITTNTLELNTSQINVSSLAEGIYFARFNFNGTYKNIRFIKH
tara:strand:- start:24826 stop:26616 length:1791 start_codon:yes stop_codon:yes gene_type:complete